MHGCSDHWERNTVVCFGEVEGEAVEHAAGANQVVLVFDLTSRESFQSCKKWLRAAAKGRWYEGRVPGCLVGNKSDNQSARQVSTQEGQALAAEYDVRFIEASAKADVNVTEAFQAIAQQVIDRIPRGASRPASRQLSAKKSSKKSCYCLLYTSDAADE